ncbi:MAG: hypothetical protein ACRCY9_13620, partial [Phycicoccus sp.]
VETAATIELLVDAGPESLLGVIRTAATVKLGLGVPAVLFVIVQGAALGAATLRARLPTRGSASLTGGRR